jgi:hypothetical protein
MNFLFIHQARTAGHVAEAVGCASGEIPVVKTGSGRSEMAQAGRLPKLGPANEAWAWGAGARFQEMTRRQIHILGKPHGKPSLQITSPVPASLVIQKNASNRSDTFC